MTFDRELDEAFKARLPVLYIETGQEVRAIEAITRTAATQRNPRRIWTWTAALGLVDPDGKTVANTSNPVRALSHASNAQESAVFVFCDLHAYLGSEHRQGEPAVIRTARETGLEFRHGEWSRTLILISPV